MCPRNDEERKICVWHLLASQILCTGNVSSFSNISCIETAKKEFQSFPLLLYDSCVFPFSNSHSINCFAISFFSFSSSFFSHRYLTNQYVPFARAEPIWQPTKMHTATNPIETTASIWRVFLASSSVEGGWVCWNRACTRFVGRGGIGNCGLTDWIGTNPTVRVVVRKTGARSAQERMLEIIIIAREMKKRNL